MKKKLVFILAMLIMVCSLGLAGCVVAEVLPNGPCKHADIQGEVRVAPTCAKDGVLYKYCDICGKGWEEVIPLVEDAHNYEGVGTQTTQPTCEKDGYITYRCQNEGCKIKDVVEGPEKHPELKAMGHGDYEWITTVFEDPTDGRANVCVYGGQKLLVCKKCLSSTNEACHDCKEMIKDVEAIPAEGHDVTSEWKIKTVPTEKQAGSIVGFCKVCGWKDAEETLPKLNAQDYTYVAGEIPAEKACTKTTIDKYSITVKGWSHTFEVTIPAVPHKYNGVDMDLYGVYTPDEVEFVYANAPVKCKDSKATGSFTCDACDVEFVVKVQKPHAWSEPMVVKAATCSREGSQKKTCTECGTVKTTPIGRIDHLYNEDKFEVHRTPEDEVDEIWLLCQNAGDGVCEQGPKKYKGGAEPDLNVKPTCTTPGEIVYYYIEEEGAPKKYCIEYTDPIPHYYTEETNSVNTDKETVYTFKQLKEIFGNDLSALTFFSNAEATCFRNGYVGFDCTGCGESFILKTIGDHEVEITVKEATCTKPKTIITTCKTCGNVTIKEDGEALKHTYTVTKAPTKQQAGEAEQVCPKGCTSPQTITLPAITEANGWKLKETVAAGDSYCEHFKEEVWEWTVPGRTETIEMRIVVIADHDAAVELDWIGKDGLHYYGYYCKLCDKAVITDVKSR